MTIKKCVLVIALAIIAVALVSLARKEVWDGGFQQIEYRVTFLDENSQPLKDVQLRVLDDQGNTTFGYPVTDFTDECIPASDENGTMIFHHVSLGMEFGGHCHYLFWMIPIGTCFPPKYTLHFLLSARPIASFAYTDLESPGHMAGWKNLPKITRKWEQKGSSSPSLPEHLRIEKRMQEGTLSSQLEYYVISKTIIVIHP